MFGLLILPQGTVLQRRRGRTPGEPVKRGPTGIFAYRLLYVPPGAVAQAMIDRGNRILDGGWTFNHTESPAELNARVLGAREARGR